MTMISIILPVCIAIMAITTVTLSSGTIHTDGTTHGTTHGMDGMPHTIVMATSAGIAGVGAGIVIQDGTWPGGIMDAIVTICTIMALHTITGCLTGL